VRGLGIVSNFLFCSAAIRRSATVFSRSDLRAGRKCRGRKLATSRLRCILANLLRLAKFPPRKIRVRALARCHHRRTLTIRARILLRRDPTESAGAFF